jgi:hypothetical protein
MRGNVNTREDRDTSGAFGRRRNRLRTGAFLAAIIASLLAVVGFVPVTENAHAATANGVECSTESFEAGVGPWSTWWAGSAQRSTLFANTGAASLELAGATGTARRSAGPGDCGGVPIASVTFSARTGTGTAVLFLVSRSPGWIAPGGPYRLTTDWSRITVPITIAADDFVAFEVSRGSAATYIDDVVISAETASTTTAPTSTGCDVDDFETGFGSWSPWWSGIIEHTLNARTGVRALHLSAPLNTAGTAQRTLRSSDCSGSINALQFYARPDSGVADFWVKVVGATTNVYGPFRVTGTGWTRIEVPVNLASGSALIGIETSTYFRISIDDVRVLTSGPSSTIPPTTVAPRPCDADFETDLGAWTPWWNGAVERVASGAGSAWSMHLTGSPQTAQERCALAFDAVSFAARSPYGPSRLYVKVVRPDGTSLLRGPLDVDATYPWRTYVVSGLNAPAGSSLFIESYGPDVYVDEIDVQTAGDPPVTTAVPTTLPATSTTTTTTPPACATDTFTTGLDGWGPWFSGTVARVDAGGEAFLRLSKNPTNSGTATKTYSAGACPGQQSVEVRVRGNNTVYLKTQSIDSGLSTSVGPIFSDSTWKTVSLPVTWSGATLVGIEAVYDNLDVDDVRLTTTVVPTTTTTTTAPPVTTTTLPAGLASCLDDPIGPDGGFFTEWYDGDVTRSLATPSSAVPDGWVARVKSTARRIVPSDQCSAPIVRASVIVIGLVGDTLQLDCVALGATESVRTIHRYTGQRDVVSVPCPATANGVLVGLWSHGACSGNSPCRPSVADIDRLELFTQSVPPSNAAPGRVTVTVPAAGLQANNASIYVSASGNGAPITEYRASVGLLFDESGARVPGLLSALTAHGATVGFTLPASAGGWEGVVQACNINGCGPSTNFTVSEVRPQPAGACRVEDYEYGEVRANEFVARSTGLPSIAVTRYAPWGNYVQLGMAADPDAPPGDVYARRGDASRLIDSRDCVQSTITSVRVHLFSPDGSPITARIVGSGGQVLTSQTVTPVNGDVWVELPLTNISSGGVTLEVLWRGHYGPVARNGGTPVPGIRNLVFIGS